MGTKGVILINVGTPDQPTVESVRYYLREFLLDPNVIDAPYVIRHLLVRGLILRFRPRKIAPRYQEIWMEEGSPLRVYTGRMSKAIQSKLSDEIVVEYGMRYGNPTIRSALERLRNRGVDELLVAPLFPQYAQATTETSRFAVDFQMKQMGWNPTVKQWDDFYDNPAFIEPLTNSIKGKINEKTHLLFSFHGLPLSHIRRVKRLGKPNYVEHCESTVSSVVKKLGLNESQWSMSYQSRLGPVRWLTPSTDSVVKNLGKRGIENLVIVSPAFVADGLETLEELDIEARETFKDSGGGNVTVINCLNDNEQWIEGVKSLIIQGFENPRNSVFSK
ncbi:MAG TPA: ferrochelatase [Candidatus Thalassarchaeaceae archaeon]|nr:ferrochelatase [Candidatus Thalassarchaeaceae archaeon]